MASQGDDWSAIYRGRLQAPTTGKMQVCAESDDGLVVRVDNTQYINTDAITNQCSALFDVTEGTLYPLEVRFQEEGGNALLRLSWRMETAVGAQIFGRDIIPSARLFPPAAPFEAHFTDIRGTDFRIKYTEKMRSFILSTSRWRGKNIADEDGCYVHYLPTHGPNIYDSKSHAADDDRAGISGIVFPQWAVGFEKPFSERIGVEIEKGRVTRVHGNGADAEASEGDPAGDPEPAAA